MEYLQQLASNSEIPFLTAFILGIMTAVSPCPLATNISAVGFISKDLQSRKRVFFNGLVYTLGRAFSYTVLGTILIIALKQGSSVFKLQRAISTYGEQAIGPFLIIMGVFMLGLFTFNFSLLGKWTSRLESSQTKGGFWGVFFMGVVFALAFCPYSGILYFGGLIPLSVSSSTGYLLPFVFAIATGLPVMIFAWILAYSVSSLGTFYNRIKTFEFWFRRVVSIVFILVGAYFVYIIHIK